MVFVSLSLSREPLFRRNIVSFGATNLRATLCYALLHLGRPKEGDVVMDHMCGGASIPLEVRRRDDGPYVWKCVNPSGGEATW